MSLGAQLGGGLFLFFSNVLVLYKATDWLYRKNTKIGQSEQHLIEDALNKSHFIAYIFSLDKVTGTELALLLEKNIKQNVEQPFSDTGQQPAQKLIPV